MASRQAVLGMEQGSFGYGGKPVFKDVSLLLDDARTGLVGENGTGKSTLLKCLSGELELNRGKVLRSRNLRVGALPQETPADLEILTVRSVLSRSLEKVGAEGEEWRIDVLLDEIGLKPETADASFGALSGGWRRLVMIAGVARLEEPDILVLDEPTNHLDLGHIAVLENWLTSQFKLPMLIVSHDRAFLDRVTDRTLFLRSDGVQSFKATFSQAREALLRLDAARARQRDLEEKEVRRLEQAAARYKVWAVKNPALNKRKSLHRDKGRPHRSSTHDPSTKPGSADWNSHPLTWRRRSHCGSPTSSSRRQGALAILSASIDSRWRPETRLRSLATMEPASPLFSPLWRAPTPAATSITMGRLRYGSTLAPA